MSIRVTDVFDPSLDAGETLTKGVQHCRIVETLMRELDGLRQIDDELAAIESRKLTR